jgi:hypothetical protein
MFCVSDELGESVPTPAPDAALEHEARGRDAGPDALLGGL